MTAPRVADCAVVGAGPAGAAAALVLARAGASVWLVDRGARGPARPGESLPGAARPLLRDLGVLDAVERGPHLPCWGNVSAWGSAEPVPTDFIADPHGPGWHLERPRFDADLRDAAREAGAVLREGTVGSLARSGGVWHLHGGGAEVKAAWLVDATGRTALAARRGLARRSRDDALVALFVWARLPGGGGGGRRDHAGPGWGTGAAGGADHGRGAGAAGGTDRGWGAGAAGDADPGRGAGAAGGAYPGRGAGAAGGAYPGRGAGAAGGAYPGRAAGAAGDADPGRGAGAAGDADPGPGAGAAGDVGAPQGAPAWRDTRTWIEAAPDGWWYGSRLPDGRAAVAFHTDADGAVAILHTPGAWGRRLGETVHVGGALRGAAFPETPRGTEACGARLDHFAGPGWLAVGDAALSFDPLSAQGIFAALYTGLRGGQAVAAALSGATGAVEAYASRLESIRAAYLRQHAHFYGRERRWPERPFWQRRQGAGGGAYEAAT